jgi:hypothetical protein
LFRNQQASIKVVRVAVIRIASNSQTFQYHVQDDYFPHLIEHFLFGANYLLIEVREHFDTSIDALIQSV